MASFTKEINSRITKHPLVFNGRLANHGLTSSVKRPPEDNQLQCPKHPNRISIWDYEFDASQRQCCIHKNAPPGLTVPKTKSQHKCCGQGQQWKTKGHLAASRSEDDQASGPALPAREDLCLSPATSTHEDSSWEEAKPMGPLPPALEAQRPAPVVSTSKILHGKRTVRPSSASMIKVIGAPPNPAPKLTRSPLYPQKPHQPILVTPHANAIDPHSVCSVLVTTNPSSASMHALRAPHQHTTATPVMACSPAIAHPGPIPNTKPPVPVCVPYAYPAPELVQAECDVHTYGGPTPAQWQPEELRSH